MLEAFIGWTVEVYYLAQTTLSDRAILTRVEERWICLTRHPGKPREENLLIPVSAIRLVKPVTPPQDDMARMLRPPGLRR